MKLKQLWSGDIAISPWMRLQLFPTNFTVFELGFFLRIFEIFRLFLTIIQDQVTLGGGTVNRQGPSARYTIQVIKALYFIMFFSYM